MRRLLSLALIVAAGIPILFSTTAYSDAEMRPVEAVHLRVVLDGREVELLLPMGIPGTVSDPRKGTLVRLVPVLVAGLEGQSRVALHVLEGADQTTATLVDVILLPETGETTASIQPRLDIELLGVGEMQVPLDLTPSGSQMRPVECCISCDGLPTCGFCVYTRCGSCCTG